MRQQVFYFDPNYRDQMTGAGVEGLTLIPPSGGAGAGQPGGSASTGGLLASEFFEGAGSMVDDGNRPNQQQQQQQPGRFAAHVGGAVSAKHGVVGPAGGSMKVRPAPALQHVRHASTGNMNTTVHAAAQAHGAGTSSHSQEELLRQLFPSWF